MKACYTFSLDFGEISVFRVLAVVIDVYIYSCTFLVQVTAGEQQPQQQQQQYAAQS